ncbi:MAG: DUF4349 domain-containing protein [Kibdelosporangium sp.]
MSRRKSGLLLAGVALLLGMTACSGADSGSGAPVALSAPGEAKFNAEGEAAAPDVPNAQRDKQQQTEKQQQQQQNAPVQDRQLVQTAKMELTAEDPFDVVFRARGIASSVGGFTGQEDSSNGRASLTLRIPADRFDSALDQLSKLGTVKTQNKQADDVTDQAVDLDARLATQRASVDRMRALLARAASVAEIAQIEGELTRREADLESLQGRRNALGNKVALSTVTVLVTKQAAPPQNDIVKADTGFLSGLTEGWGAFGTFVNAIATAIGALLPFLVALAIPVALVLYYRRRNRKRTPTSTPPQPPAPPRTPATPAAPDAS